MLAPMTRFSWLVVMVVAAACGGGVDDTSGVDQSKVATTLTASERTDFCAWAIEVQGGPGHVTQCGPDVTVTAPTQAECEMDFAMLPQTAECMAVTVEDVEGCVNAVGSSPCTAFESQACSKWIMCVFSGS